MARLMGILTGSALAIGALILTIGLPQFNAPRADVQGRSERVSERDVATGRQARSEPLPQPDGGTGDNIAVLEQELADEGQSTGRPLPEPKIDTAGDGVPEAPAQAAGVLPDEAANVASGVAPDTPPSEPDAHAAPPDTATQQWFAFWSPFRSEIAANGFVAQLQRSTGLDYRVIKLKQGAYEVAFAYSDAADIRNKLARISSATGLDLPDG